MNGSILAQEGALEGIISADSFLDATIDVASGYDRYTGKTIVEPDFIDQVLPTENKVVASDITIKKIKVSYTPNEGGGQTVYIG